MDVGIVAKQGSARGAELAAELRARLREDGVGVRLDEATASTLGTEGVAPGRMDDYDLVVTIGGDGTFLFVAHNVGTTPILGVNLGEVGFLNAVAPAEAVEVVTGVIERAEADGEVHARELDRLVARGEGWSLVPALNEIVVQGGRRGHGGGVEYTVRVDGSLYSGGRGDGVLVASPTGSTAYNLSEGGPLVHPDVDALVVNETVAREGMPPLVAPLAATIAVTVDDGEAYVVSDGRTRRALDPPTSVTVERAAEPVRVAGPQANFFEALGKLE